MKFRPCFELFFLDGKFIPKDVEGKEPAVLADVAINALMADIPGQQVPGEKKFHRYQIAQRIKHARDSRAEEIDLPTEDIAMIKDCIGKIFGPSVMGPAWQAIESAK